MSPSLMSGDHQHDLWPERLLRYWGKAMPVETGPEFHPLVFHSLDVAAVGVAYLRRHPSLRRQFSHWLGIGDDEVVALISFLLAIHDLGKFADNFQRKRDDLAEILGVAGRANCRAPHDQVSRGFWRKREDKILPVLAEYVGGLTDDDWECLAVASFGHHGKPPAEYRALGDAMFEGSSADALTFIGCCARLLLRERIVVRVEPKDLAKISWSLSGLTVLCDWIGSNTSWFKYRTPDSDIGSYWASGLVQADVAIEAAGVCVQPALPYAGAVNLFESLRDKVLRPAQQLVETLDIGDGPQLFVLEDATGSGKTEAALALCARLMSRGVADGFYFALPTQATADQMFDRINLSMTNPFALPTLVSCVLSHSAREQHPWYQQLRGRADGADRIENEEETASFRVSEWLGQSNKRSLIAQLGAGTVDQCMLGVLRSKHQSLRLLGMQRKVLIVDEVHSYDAYITAILGELIQAQAALGGSVILLSATLSAKTRAFLIARFLSGQTGGLQRSQVLPHAPYPLLTCTDPAGGMRAHALPASPASRRRVEVDYLSDAVEVYARIGRWMTEGKCVVWIRNTVSDALAAYAELAPIHGSRCTLFHSRFALVDRQRIQHAVLSDLGKKSTRAEGRHGRLIIATQVLSQSLDLDADEMISDLAPIDELLQRQGRLRRHIRNVLGATVDIDDISQDARGPTRLTVFGPALHDEPAANWYNQFSRGAARVYEDHGRLWLTARYIQRGLNLPDDFRSLVDRVYDQDVDIPSSLSRSSERTEGTAAGQKQTGIGGCIKLADGFVNSGDWPDEERITTRLGDSVEAVLARVARGRLVPWAPDHDHEGWALSAIRIPGWWLGRDGEPIGDRALPADPALAALVNAAKLEVARLRYRVILVSQTTEYEVGSFEIRSGVILTYDRTVGLAVE